MPIEKQIKTKKASLTNNKTCTKKPCAKKSKTVTHKLATINKKD